MRGCFYVKKILTVFLPEQRRDFVLPNIKQIKCLDGKLYLAAALNCYNGEIVGLAMEDNKKGCASGISAEGMTLHSDRGNRLPAMHFAWCWRNTYYNRRRLQPVLGFYDYSF